VAADEIASPDLSGPSRCQVPVHYRPSGQDHGDGSQAQSNGQEAGGEEEVHPTGKGHPLHPDESFGDRLENLPVRKVEPVIIAI
jgi:hypothetical protein